MSVGGKNGITQRKTLAMGDKLSMDGGNFGVRSLSDVNGPGRSQGGYPTESTNAGLQSRTLSDDARSAGLHVSRGPGQMGATRHSDHGPHLHD